jgi:hypothetical protein
MRNRSFIGGSVVMILAFLAGASTAQSQMLHRGMAQQGMQAAIQEKIVTLTGTVTAVNLAPGQGMPSITLQENLLGSITVLVGPYRVLAESKFEIKPAQVLQVKAFPDPRVANAYVATEIRDDKGAVAVLRSEAGMPLNRGGAWGMRGTGAMGRGMMRSAGPMRGMHGGPGMGDCAICTNLDIKAKKTLAGIVQSVEMGSGLGMPGFTLSVAGKAVVIIASPFWALQQADFKISAGDSLSVVAYPSLQQEGCYVAAEIINATTQKSIKLRDENGIPLGMRGRGPMQGGRR